MCEISILKRCFNPDALIPTETYHDTRTKVTLLEPEEPNSSCSIMNIPSDTLVINVDAKFDNSKLFSGKNGCCKRSDFMLISAAKQCVLFIEIKKSNSSTQGHLIKQLKGSFCVYTYCRSVIKTFFGEDFLDGYKLRFIAIQNNVNMNKRPTVDRTSSIHDSPDSMMKVNSRNEMQFKMLACLGSS